MQLWKTLISEYFRPCCLGYLHHSQPHSGLRIMMPLLQTAQRFSCCPEPTLQIREGGPDARTHVCLVYVLLISSDNLGNVLGLILSYQGVFTPVGSERLSTAAPEVAL